MSETQTLIAESADRLLGDLCTKETLDAAEAGTWPERLWAEIEAAGFPTALAVSTPDEAPDFEVAAAILRAAGHHAAPVPLAETMLGAFLLSACGLAAPQGPLTVAPLGHPEALRLAVDAQQARLGGIASRVPFASRAARIVIVARSDHGSAVTALDPARCEFRPGRNYAGEPRDEVSLEGVTLPLAETAPLAAPLSPERIFHLATLLRTVMMAGALERVLALAAHYASERVQFGHPIARFQVIRQQLAVLAGEVAAADMASRAAVAAAGGDGLVFAVAAAKIRVGEAAGKAAAIAHQVHGAIGFTHEHTLHHATRRLWSWRDELGSESEWAELLGREVAGRGAEALWPLITRA